MKADGLTDGRTDSVTFILYIPPYRGQKNTFTSAFDQLAFNILVIILPYCEFLFFLYLFVTTGILGVCSGFPNKEYYFVLYFQ